MKKICYLVLLVGLGLSLGLMSCDNEEAYLTINTDALGFNADNNISRTVYVLSDNVGWSIEVESAAQGWITAVKDGPKIIVSVGDFDGSEARSGRITVIPDKSSVSSQVIVVTQDIPTEYSMTVSDSELTFKPIGYSAQTVAVTLENLDWRFSVLEGDDWLSVTRPAAGNTLSVIPASDKYTPGSRQAQIKISPDMVDKMLPIIISVSQEGMAFSALPGDLEFLSEPSGNKIINVTAENVNWTAELKNTAEDAWISTLTVSSDRITVGVDENEGPARTGAIVIKSNNTNIQDIEITVTQISGAIPSPAGDITVSDVTETSALLTVGEIEKAGTYKWYLNGVEVANTTNTYTATTEGYYKVAGVNAAAEGVASPEIPVQFTLKFTDIPYGIYVANGTPDFFSEAGASTWTNLFVPQNDYYTIVSFADLWNTYIDFLDGVLYIDNYSRLGGTVDGLIHGFFDAIYWNGTEYITLSEYSPTYDKFANVLDFSGTYNGAPVLIGIGGHAINQGGTAIVGGFTDFYRDLKLTITPVVPSPGAVMGAKSESAPSFTGTPVSLEGLITTGGVEKFDPAKFSRE